MTSSTKRAVLYEAARAAAALSHVSTVEALAGKDSAGVVLRVKQVGEGFTSEGTTRRAICESELAYLVSNPVKAWCDYACMSFGQASCVGR